MLSEAYINIVLQAFGGMICLLLWIFLQFIWRDQERLDKLFQRFLMVNIMLQFLNLVSRYFHGRPGTAVYVIVVVMDFLILVLHYTLLGTITDYLAAYLQQNGARCKALSPAVWTIFAIGIVMLVVSQFNGMYYTIDAQNRYIRQPGTLLYFAIIIFALVIDLCVFLHHRKKLPSKEYRVFVSCMVIAIAAASMQAVVFGVFYFCIIVTFAAVCIFISIQVEQTNRLNEKELELEKSQTTIMLSQIQPHFLYNSLLGIKQLCDVDPKRASDALEHFSYYLRSNLDSLTDDRLIPFDKELVHVKDYLYLEKMRFPKKLTVEWDISFTDFLLPSLTLQPIVENAVRHGITKKRGGGTVTIQSERIEDAVVLTVTDTGTGFDENEKKDDGHSHIGIENVRNRLIVQCGGSLLIESEKGAGTQAKIIIPQREGYNADYSG